MNSRHRSWFPRSENTDLGHPSLVHVQAVKVLGGLGIVAVAHMLQSFLSGVGSMDPLVPACSIFAILLLTLAACVLAAMRAAKTDPELVLRGE